MATLLVALVLAIPGVAQAQGKWYVNNKSGRHVGYVKLAQVPVGGGPIGGKVFNLGMTHRGWVSPAQEAPYVGWWIGSAGFGEKGWVVKSGRARFSILKRIGGSVCGRCFRGSSGRWVVQKVMHGRYVRVGTVTGSCPGAYAAGAGKIMLW